MTTAYPAALDDFTNPSSSDRLDAPGVSHASQHANVNDAIEAIQTELGLLPSAGYSDVAARLSAVDSEIADRVPLGIPAVADVAVMLNAKLNAGLSASFMVFGDSTSDEAADWVYRVAERLGDSWPSHSVTYYSGGTGGWGSAVPVSSGTGTETITVWNASKSGWDSQDWIDTIPDLTSATPDLILVDLGHNDPVGEGFTTVYSALVDLIITTWPDRPVIPVVQNHNQNDLTKWDDRRPRVHQIAAERNLPVIEAPFYAFGGDRPVADLYLDNVHPSVAGQVAYKNAMLAALRLPTDEFVSASNSAVSGMQIQVNRLVSELLTPVQMLNWSAAYWASDSNWSNPADGAGVSEWSDGSGNNRNISQASTGAMPLYRASTALFNNRPTVEFDGTNDYLELLSQTIPQPVTIIAIAAFNNVGAGRTLVGLTNNTGRRVGTGTSSVTFYASNGAAIQGGVPAINRCYLLRFVLNGASSAIYVDEVSTATGNGGSDGLTHIVVGAARQNTTYQNWMSGHVAFIGIAPGDVSTDPNWPSFLLWAESFYGISL